MTDLTFDLTEGITFEVEKETRTIKGLALPFGQTATSAGRSWTFSKDTLTWGKVTLLNGHDWSQVLGVVDLEQTDEGLLMSARVANTRLGDEVLELAEMGAISGLSVGVAADAKSTLKNGVHFVTSGTIREVSTTPIPAFESANIRSVAASANPLKETTMEETNTIDEVGTLKADIDARFSSLDEKIDKLTTFAQPLDDSARVSVNEEPLYRFDAIGAASGRDFSTDFFAAIRGDQEASVRLLNFTNESILNPTGLNFVASTNVSSVNPSQYRPELFKDEAPAQPTPMYDTFYAGGLSSVTPFFYSKMGTYSTLTADHVEGTPPTAGTFTTEAGATITPSAISGRVFVTREVADADGNPQVSALIWSKVQRAFRQSLETKTAAVLHGGLAGFTALASPSTGATGKQLTAAIKQGLVDLTFTSNGGRYSKFFAAKDLYSQLAAGEDTAGRPLLPVIAPTNADGSAASRLGAIELDGIKLEPTWSTEILYGGNSDEVSYFVDPSAVKVWNSGLTKIEKTGETAAGWNVDVFAYVATHLYDATGIRKLSYSIS